MHGDVLNSPAALLFLKMIVFPGEDLPEIAAREAVTGDIILKASGQRPLVNPVQLGILIVCLLTFLSAPTLWAAGWILRKRQKGKTIATPHQGGFGSWIIRFYGLMAVALLILFYGALIRAPFLMYWPELPGWIDGISLTENLFLALPTLLAFLSCGMALLAIWVWLRKYWTFPERLHFTWLAVCMGGYILLLDHWHLVGVLYYWSYLLR
jgi:hypothetical protein